MPANSVSGAQSPTCPSLFTPTAAQDGKLVRIRVPGGILSSQQCRVLADAVANLGIQSIDVTNRANLQIRGLRDSMPQEVLLKLQDAKLAAKITELDRFRNIMASPTAGIDPEQLIDICPLIQQLDEYLSSNLDLAGLSPKFSVGIDGGEKVSIQEQCNDILFKAVKVEGEVLFHLYLAGKDAQKAVMPEKCVDLVGAIARLYLDAVPANMSRKPRLKQVIEEIGFDSFVDRLDLSASELPKRCSAAKFLHLGIHSQIQPDFSYIGVALPLGRWKLPQLQAIAEISDGSGVVRLTPWRSILIPDISDRDVAAVERELEQLGLSPKNNNIWGGLIACSGTSGCAAAFTDTQADAIALAQYMADNITLDQPATIHLSGCPKSCAHHGSSDLTLVGAPGGDSGAYHLYGGDAEFPFGKQILSHLEPSQLPQKVTQILSSDRESAESRLSETEFSRFEVASC